jgi:hypothetical protein
LLCMVAGELIFHITTRSLYKLAVINPVGREY